MCHHPDGLPAAAPSCRPSCPASRCSAKDQADLQRCCGGCEQRVQVVNNVINASIKEFQVGGGCKGQAVRREGGAGGQG